jgi:hypothetical protein
MKAAHAPFCVALPIVRPALGRRKAMPALEQKRLLEACRALGEVVGGQPMLPPLIRDAGEGDGSGGTVHYPAAGDARIRFETRFDKAYVNRHEFPLKRLPLLIDCVLCDSERRPQATALDEQEKFALLCAFFLAAQTPIGVEPIEDGGEYRLSLRLSPTFVVEWREAFEPAALESCETLCRRVAASLWDKSREFFANERIGVAVWSLRAAQELLGAPRLSAKAVEDFVAASLVESREDRDEAPVPPLAQSRAGALALMISPNPAPTAIQAVSPALLDEERKTVPAPAADRKVALGGKARRGVATGLVAALIPLTLMVSVGAFMTVYRKGEVEAPRVEATPATGAPPPAAAAASGAREPVAATEPPHAESAHPAAEQKPAQSAATAKPAAAPKPFARRTAHAATKPRHARNPFAQARRAVGRFATDVWDGLSSIPRRFGGGYSYYQDY